MTKQILAQDLQPDVIDRHGRAYRIPEWKSSFTFKAGEQENLVVADNRTVNFSEAGAAHRQSLEKLSWVHPWNWNSDSPAAQIRLIGAQGIARICGRLRPRGQKVAGGTYIDENNRIMLRY